MWYNYNHMYGWFPFGGIMMFVFWIAVILIIIWAYKEFSGNFEISNKKSAIDILKERYAKGEIDKKEFDEKQKDLSS